MTDVALKEHLERMLFELDRRYQQRFELNDSAIAKAERTMNDRLNAMNEFRDALRDQANRMATRVEVEALSEQVNAIRRDKANMDGRLAVLAFVISTLVSLGLWGLTRFTQ